MWSTRHSTQSHDIDVPNWDIQQGLHPLCDCAAGRMLLSRKSDVEVQHLLWRINAEEFPRRWMEIGSLLRELEQIRRQGFACTEATSVEGAAVIVVELPTPSNRAPMALGIGCPVDTLREQRDHYLATLRYGLQEYSSHRAGRDLNDSRAP